MVVITLNFFKTCSLFPKYMHLLNKGRLQCHDQKIFIFKNRNTFFKATTKRYSLPSISFSSKGHIKQIATEWAARVAAALKPAKHACCVEALATGAALHTWQLVVATMKNAVAYSAVLHAFKLLLKIASPKRQAIQNGAVLILNETK